MALPGLLRRLKNKINSAIFKFSNTTKEQFECPICHYTGPFMDFSPSTGRRRHAQCPGCHALERHRIQYVVVNKLLQSLPTAQLHMLHFAPEPFFREYFSRQFGGYETADLIMKNVDHTVNLEQIPFDDESFDFIFASHVLEHVPDDGKAISEIRRILRPGGIAILPVPLVAEKTVEYPEPNPHESFHVRAPGLDYFERYQQHFSKIEQYSSDRLPHKYQLFTYENRKQWPTKEVPLRPAMLGEKHIDIVPVCYV